jgi:hypothetical protein
MKSILRTIGIFFFFNFIAYQEVSAQFYDMPGGTIDICKGFFRDTGADSTYANFEEVETTFCSVSADFQMSIFFDFIQLETNYDFLYIYDGPDSSYPLIATYTGSFADVDICASGQCLTFKFTSDYSIIGNGWFGTITCGSCIPTYNMQEGTFETCSGLFQDPGANGNYSNNLNVTTTFCSDNGENLTVLFNIIALELNYDYLYVYDGLSIEDSLIATLNGNLQEVELCSTTGCLTFNFVTDDTVTAAGWSAEISCGACTEFYDMPAGTYPTCSGVFRDSGGGNNYTNNENLVTTFCSANPGENVFVNFEFINVELNYDYLYVHDGPDITSPIIAVYNGNYTNVEICSSGDCLTFRFTSDGSVLNPGWRANISCGSCSYLPETQISMSTGRINTCDALFLDSGGHNAYSDNESFVQTICASEFPSSLRVDFLWMQIEANYDYLTVFDGPSATGDSLAQFTGNFQNQSFCSDSGCLTFRFTTDGSVTRPGWLAFVSCDESCNGVITEVESILPSIPGILLYPNPANDLLNIKAAFGNEVVSISIISSSGQEVLQSVAINEFNSLNITHLNTGLYVIRFTGNNWTQSATFIKQ